MAVLPSSLLIIQMVNAVYVDGPLLEIVQRSTAVEEPLVLRSAE